MSKRFYFKDVLTFVVLLALVGACYLLFPYLFKRDYFEWYLEKGAKITWAMAVFTLVWGDLNKFPSLISSHPSEYLASYARLLSEFFLLQAVFGVVKPRSNPPIISNYSLDSCISFPLNMLLSILMLVWAVLIAPIQYFLFIICGAPARRILCSQQKIKESNTDWFTGTLSQKPISVTAAFTGITLWILNLFLN